MLYKKVIKRGVTDLTFIQNFLVEKLQDKAMNTVNINNNVLDKILMKYGRVFKGIKSNRSEIDFLIYNDEKYSFYVELQGQSGKYGYYYKLTIIDNLKSAEYDYNYKLECYNKELNKSSNKDIIIKSGIYDLYKELFKIDFIDNFNPFKVVNFIEGSTINNLKMDKEEIRKELINRIEALEEQYNLD